jgi:uncharacterized RDD family membrane protein YckC
MIMDYKTRPEFPHDNEFILATIRRRFLAFLIDWIVLVLIYLFFITLLSLLNMAISKINVHGIFEVELEVENAHSYFITFLKLFFGLLPVLYFALSFYFWSGKTIGKYFVRLRVLSLYHERLGLWHCIERSLGYFASALEFGFGYIQAFWNPNRMTLHDKIGETIVVEFPKFQRKRMSKIRQMKPEKAKRSKKAQN